MVIYPLPNNEHIKKIEELAEQNDPCAQLDLALIYRDECNDYSACRSWLRRLMNNETPDAEQWEKIRSKARMSCRNYRGVPKDHGQDSLKDINYYLMAISESASPKQAESTYFDLLAKDEMKRSQFYELLYQYQRRIAESESLPEIQVIIEELTVYSRGDYWRECQDVIFQAKQRLSELWVSQGLCGQCGGKKGLCPHTVKETSTIVKILLMPFKIILLVVVLPFYGILKLADKILSLFRKN